MLSEVFYWLFNMSVVASLSGLFVLLLRLFKKLPRRVTVILWAIPFLRMWIPIGIGGKYGLMTFLSRFTTKTVTVWESRSSQELTGLPNFSMTNAVMAANSYFPITYKVDLVGDVFAVAAVVWAVVCAALLLTFIVLYVVTMREVKSAMHLYDNAFYSDKVSSPAVYGVFRPKIVIPATLAEKEDLRYILLHEQKHIGRLDNLWRILAFATAALHWFNPLSWIFLKCFLSDIEIACDEAVLQKCSDDEKKEYARTLLGEAESKTVFLSAFGGAKIKTRIEHILSYKKMTAFAAAAFAVLVAFIAYFLLTNAN